MLLQQERGEGQGKVGAVGAAPGATGHLCRPARGTRGADGQPLTFTGDTTHL